MPRETWRRSWQPPDPRPIYTWAAENIDLPRGPFAISGNFDPERSRWLLPIFDDLHDSSTVRTIDVAAPVRGCKTLIGDIWLPYCAVTNPGGFMWTTGEEGLAKTQAARTLAVLKNSPAGALLPWKYDVQAFVLTNGMPVEIQGTARSNLQAKGRRYAVNDECWLWAPGRMAEAAARLGDYLRLGISKCLNLSQGGTPGDDFTENWMAGTRHEDGAACMGCGKLMQLRWNGARPDGTHHAMMWDEHRKPNGKWDVNRTVPTARFVCEHCSHEHGFSARTLAAWNLSAEYIQTNTDPEPNHTSYRPSGLRTYPWDELCREYLLARNSYHDGIMGPLVTWWQKRFARSVDESSFHEERHTRTERIEITEKTNPLDGERFRAMQIDRQREGLYWVQTVSINDNFDVHVLWFGKLYGSGDLEAKRKEWGVQPGNVAFDSGFESKSDGGVYSICIDFGYIAVKGVGDRAKFTHIKIVGKNADGTPRRVAIERSYAPRAWGDPGIGKEGKSNLRCPLVRFSSDIMADRLDAFIKAGKYIVPEVMDPTEMSEEYKLQMSAEVKVSEPNKWGRKVEHWKCLSGKPNHAWDLGKILMLQMTTARIIPDSLEG